jgi:GNAT superfamily N-acetyltransferase
MPSSAWGSASNAAVSGSSVDDLRGRGVGRELMAQAEARAVERGCHAAWLDTFSFQARGFYEKLGYEEFGTLDYPPIHKRYFMKKLLVAAP